MQSDIEMSVLVVDAIRPYQDAILALVFFGFFLGTVAALAFRDRPFVVKGYLGCFFTAFIVVNLVGLTVSPFVSMHKFPINAGDGASGNYLYLVDGNGNEILVDPRAIPPAGTRDSDVAGKIIEVDTDEQQALADYIIDESNEYREYVESDPAIRRDRVTYPEHGAINRWTSSDLEGIGEFVAIRVYEQRIQFTDDSTAVESESCELVVEVEYEGE